MKNRSIIFLLVLTTFFASCYEDKGNYDYKDIQKLEIKFEKIVLNATIDEVVEIEPLLNIDIDETSPNHQFTWYVNGETRPEWNKRKFTWSVDRVFINGNIKLEIKDKRNDMIYMNQVKTNVAGIYENDYSWMILSDDNGKSLLSFLSVLETDDETGSNQLHIKKSRFIKDVYVEHNEGSLGTGPIGVQERCVNAYYTFGNIVVFQESGAVDLNGTTFKKELDFNQSFLGGQYPIGIDYLNPGTFMQRVDVVTDQEGKLYSRIKASEKVFHSEYFLHTPLSVIGETEQLSQCRVVMGFSASNRYGVNIIYDGKNKRMLAISDVGRGKYELEGAGKIEKLPAAHEGANLSQIVPLNDMKGYELLGIEVHGMKYSSFFRYGYYMILKGDDGKIYLQDFITTTKKANSNGALEVLDVVRHEITGLPGVPTSFGFPIYSDEMAYIYFAVGKELYYLELANILNGAKLYYTFDSPISAMSNGSDGNAHLAVGLEDGSFFVMGAYQAKLETENKVLYESTEKVGKIVNLRYKNNVFPSY